MLRVLPLDHRKLKSVTETQTTQIIFINVYTLYSTLV